MGVLSYELISQFVKATRDVPETKKEVTMYGTIVENGGKNYVRLDGSDILTPMIATTDVKMNERVIVLLKNHTAIVTGNVSSPSVGISNIEDLENQLGDLDKNIADIIRSMAEEIANLNTEITNLKEVTLYDNASGSNGTITLSVTSANYKYLEIFYCDGNGQANKSVKVNNPNGKNLVLDSINTSETEVIFSQTSYTISDTTITPNTTSSTSVNISVNANETSTTISSVNNIKITRVIGLLPINLKEKEGN